jgi:5-methylcytosine-specific restriction endonuclease McrA
MNTSKLSQSILELRNQGYSYKKISDILKCSKSTISYHCGKDQKIRTLQRNAQYRKNNVILKKIHRFYHPYFKKSVPKILNTNISQKLSAKIRKFGDKPMFTVSQLLNKIGDSPVCYLTGEPIDLNDSKSYQLDHIIPKSRGGDNSLDNCQIALKKANMSKSDMTYDEYVSLCKKVISHHEFKVARAGNAPASSG